MTPTSPRPLAHLELHTANQARASAFYGELLCWRSELIELAGRSYLGLDMGEDVGGGIVECGTGRALWLPYVSVSQVAASTERAEQLGAKVLLEPREGPAGWRSVIEAPDGGEVALWQWKPSRAWGDRREAPSSSAANPCSDGE
jgi:predicted enzyme related to lactoylglutathione lyase